MATNILTKIFGSRNDRLLKQYRKTVAQINALEQQLEQLTDEQLQAKTPEFKQRVASGERFRINGDAFLRSVDARAKNPE